ncbi:uncharacterized protein [Elaeis guineensis]|uniref:uncharacterized protein isoform X2 n=1 Tax=Elaeis guineensis var. tenera TaxID=51953 RepID=UPI003C6DA500
MNIQPGIVLELQLVQNLLSVYNNILCQGMSLVRTVVHSLFFGHTGRGLYQWFKPVYMSKSHILTRFWIVPSIIGFQLLILFLLFPGGMGKETGNAYCFLIIQQVETTGNSIKDEQLDIIRSTQNARTEV